MNPSLKLLFHTFIKIIYVLFNINFEEIQVSSGRWSVQLIRGIRDSKVM